MAAMDKIDGPITRAKVQALAEHRADNPSSVVEVVHHGFNADEISGGYAFLFDRSLLIYAFDGSNSWSIDPGDATGRIDEVEKYWRKSQHRHRPLGLDDVSEWHRAAIAALVSGARSVADLPLSARPGVTDTARADGLFVMLRRFTGEPTEAAALRVLAANDWLLALPREQTRAHPCPVCGLPAVGTPWADIISVCDSCHAKALCGDGRLVIGYNTDPSGGFEAIHIDDRSPCDQVTRDGGVWVDGHRCLMGEAKFGGVFVGVASVQKW
jgi:hypothetical protein